MTRPRTAVRTVAAFEAAKGTLVLLAGLGVLSWHHGPNRIIAELIRHLHLNPAKHEPHVFLRLAADATNHARWLAAGASLYIAGRYVEATGLWLGKRWGIWMAVATAAVYLPFEIVELVRRPSLLSVGALALNLAVVALLIRRHGQPSDDD